MRLDLARLPNDPILLHQAVRDLAGALDRRDGEIETLRRLVTTLKRRRFGRRSSIRTSWRWPSRRPRNSLAR